MALLARLTGLGGGTLLLLRRTNPWLIRAMALAVLLSAKRVNQSAIPQPLINAAQRAIDASLGVHLTRKLVQLAPRWLGSVALASIAMMLLCAGFAWALAKISGLHRATLLLAALPGGIGDVAISAKVLQLGVPLVTALHVPQLAGMLLLAETL